MSLLENQVAVVTGAASGMGRATTARLAEAGARVLAVDRNWKSGGEASTQADSIRSMELDVSDPEQVEKLFDRCRALPCRSIERTDQLKRLGVLVRKNPRKTRIEPRRL